MVRVLAFMKKLPFIFVSLLERAVFIICVWVGGPVMGSPGWIDGR